MLNTMLLTVHGHGVQYGVKALQQHMQLEQISENVSNGMSLLID